MGIPEVQSGGEKPIKPQSSQSEQLDTIPKADFKTKELNEKIDKALHQPHGEMIMRNPSLVDKFPELTPEQKEVLDRLNGLRDEERQAELKKIGLE